jgi:hypothetical protein
MKKMLILLLSFICVEVMALDAAQTQALNDTRQMLTSPSERAAIIANDKEAKKADAIATITVMGNSDYKEEMYAISAEILQWVAQQQNPEQLMARYKNDPTSFLKEMPPAQAQRIKNLSELIEQKRKNRAPASAAQP